MSDSGNPSRGFRSRFASPPGFVNDSLCLGKKLKLDERIIPGANVAVKRNNDNYVFGRYRGQYGSGKHEVHAEDGRALLVEREDITHRAETRNEVEKKRKAGSKKKATKPPAKKAPARQKNKDEVLHSTPAAERELVADAGPKEDRVAAKGLREEIERADGTRKKRARLIIKRFGFSRLTDNQRQRVTEALSDAGIDLSPPLSDVKLDMKVTLSIRDAPSAPTTTVDTRTAPAARVEADAAPAAPVDEPAAPAARTHGGGAPAPHVDAASLASFIRPSRMRADGHSDHARSDFTASPADGVWWFDVDLCEEPAVQEVREQLHPFCPQLALEHVEDLLDPDPHPQVKSYEGTTSDGHVTIRAGSFFSVIAGHGGYREASRGLGANESRALTFQPVEWVAGPGWLVTAWHKGERCGDGSRAPAPLLPRASDTTRQGVARRWRDVCDRPSSGPATSGDLGSLVLHELVIINRQALRDVDEWLHSMDSSSRADMDTLIEVREMLEMLGEFRKCIRKADEGASRWAGISEPRNIWFSGVSRAAKEESTVRQWVDNAQKKLGELDNRARASRDRVVAASSQKKDVSLALWSTILVGIVGVFVSIIVSGFVHSWYVASSLGVAAAALGLLAYLLFIRPSTRSPVR